jgi:hypothetical protein
VKLLIANNLYISNNHYMKLTSGHLYFINEQDVITGAHSTYYKIGIVRSSDERDSKNRLLEHQTGNPRKLCIVESAGGRGGRDKSSLPVRQKSGDG